MEKYFRTEQGELVNIVDHTLEQINLWNDLKIYIGTDSQTYRGIVRYVTAIVFRYGNRGAHYVFFAKEVPRMRDNFLRLYNEGLATIDAAQILTDSIPVQVEALEFDFAGVEDTISTPLSKVFKGYLKSKFKGAFRQNEMVATKAADHICRNLREITNKWCKEDREEFNKLRVA